MVLGEHGVEQHALFRLGVGEGAHLQVVGTLSQQTGLVERDGAAVDDQVGQLPGSRSRLLSNLPLGNLSLSSFPAFISVIYVILCTLG